MRIAELRAEWDAAGTDERPRCREALAAAVHALARAVGAGREDAFVRACAQNRARDHHRGRSGVFVVAARRAAFDDDVASDAPTPEALLLALEEARLRDARLARLRSAVAEAPPRYRAVLEAVYVRGEPIESLVTTYVASAADRRRARNAVDKTLERARNWVRARVLAT